MQILTNNGFREVADEEVILKYAQYMLMPFQRAKKFFDVIMQGSAPYPVQGLGFVIPSGLTEDLESMT